MNRTERIAKHLSDLRELMGYKEDGCNNLASQDSEVVVSYGQLFFDYVTAAQYDMNWEGFSDTELIGIEQLLADMVMFARNR